MMQDNGKENKKQKDTGRTLAGHWLVLFCTYFLFNENQLYIFD